jgi:tetratricopeptide (TPR) repeat protein
MEELRELVEIGMSGRIGRIEIFESESNEISLSHRLYYGLKRKEIKTDEEARVALYGSSREGFKFNMLKKRLKERLYNTILFVQPRQNIPGGYLENAYFCYKHFVIAKMLTIISVRKLGIRLLRKTLKRALEYEVYEVAMLCSLNLRRDSLAYGDLSKFNDLNNTFIRANNSLIMEAQAERLYHSLLIQFVRSGAVKPWQIQQALISITEIEAIKKECDSYIVNHSHFMVKVIYHELSGDYGNALTLCEKFEAYLLEKKTQYTYIRHANILLQKLDCCLYLNNFNKGQECAEKALSFYRQGEGNWYACQEAFFLLSLRTGNLDHAADIYISVVSKEKFKDLVKWRKERWELFNGYLWTLLEVAKRFDLQQKIELSARQFRLSRALNEMQTHVTDKEGYNIAILILEVIGLLTQGKYTEIIERGERLNNYVYKNLHGDPAHIRSQVFIKMLLSLIKADFDPSRIQRRIERYLEVLRKTPLRYNATQVYIEVLPFEHLWEIVKEILSVKAKPRKEAISERELHFA